MPVRVHFFPLLLIICELSNIDAECTYPPQLVANTYYDSEKGPVTFTRDTMTGWPVTLTSIQNTVTSWECYLRNGSIIVSKNKQAITMYGISFYAFVCMVVDLKDSYFFYKLWSAMEANADEERVSIKTNAQAGLCEICNKKYIADDSEIKYMCTVETCGQVDKTMYTAPVTVCSDQPDTTQTEIPVETTTVKSPSSSSPPSSSSSSSSSPINTSSSSSLETALVMLSSTTIEATIPITASATTTTAALTTTTATKDEKTTAGLSERTTQESQTSLNGTELKTDTFTSITASPSDEHPTSNSLSSVDFRTNKTPNSISTIQTTSSSSTSSRFSEVNEITTTSKWTSLSPPTTTMLTSVTKDAISPTEERSLSIAPDGVQTTHSSSITKTSTAASSAHTSTPQKGISAIFTSEALMTSIVLCVLVLFMVLISIVISMKIRKRKHLPPRVSPKISHPPHIKPMHHDNHDLFYQP